LGLRQYRNVQVDIWQGDAAVFHVDCSIRWAASASKDTVVDGLCNFKHTRNNHLGIIVESSHDLVLLFDEIKAIIERQSELTIRRVTFIAHDSLMYETLSENLFLTFEDVV